ncbi:hypothetical protein VR010_00175 [Actinomycetaceae bacterium L2_0104]
MSIHKDNEAIEPEAAENGPPQPSTARTATVWLLSTIGLALTLRALPDLLQGDAGEFEDQLEFFSRGIAIAWTIASATAVIAASTAYSIRKSPSGFRLLAALAVISALVSFALYIVMLTNYRDVGREHASIQADAVRECAATGGSFCLQSVRMPDLTFATTAMVIVAAAVGLALVSGRSAWPVSAIAAAIAAAPGSLGGYAFITQDDTGITLTWWNLLTIVFVLVASWCWWMRSRGKQIWLWYGVALLVLIGGTFATDALGDATTTEPPGELDHSYLNDGAIGLIIALFWIVVALTGTHFAWRNRDRAEEVAVGEKRE